MSKFSCTRCHAEYDVHPGLCEECGKNTVIFNTVTTNSAPVQSRKNLGRHCCISCGGTGYVVGPGSARRPCISCGALISGDGWKVDVSGIDAEEVKSVAEHLSKQMDTRTASRAIRSPWFSGSFYLAVMVVVAVVIAVIAKVVSALVLPVVLVAAILLVAVIGAFQLRQDDRLGEKNFMALMLMALSRIKFLWKQNPKESEADKQPIKTEEQVEKTRT